VNESNGFYEVKNYKAEASLYAIVVIVLILGFFALFPFGIIPIGLFTVSIAAALVWVKSKFSGPYFIKVDKEGLRFRTSFFATPLFLSWSLVDQVNFQLYEVNFRIRDSKQVINIQTNFIDEDKRARFCEEVKILFDNMVIKPHSHAS
jgi:hypothetical protein